MCDSHIEGCSECDSKDDCTTCKDRFQLNYLSKCEMCPENCAACEGECTTCMDSFFMTSDKACVQHCGKGMFADDDANCQSCSTGCMKCTDENTCSKCDRGYQVKADACEECGQNCLDCDNDICLECEE